MQFLLIYLSIAPWIYLLATLVWTYGDSLCYVDSGHKIILEW